MNQDDKDNLLNIYEDIQKIYRMNVDTIFYEDTDKKLLSILFILIMSNVISTIKTSIILIPLISDIKCNFDKYSNYLISYNSNINTFNPKEEIKIIVEKLINLMNLLELKIDD